MLMGDVHAEQLLRSIEPAILDSLSPAQESAIRAAAARNAWLGHPVDLRFSLPLLGGVYVTLLAGRERRSAARRGSARHPLDSFGNVCFAAGATVMLGALGFTVGSLLGLF